MENSDSALVKRLSITFSRYLDDQKQVNPRHLKSNVFLEIQGEFSEILDVEKNDNALLVQFLSVYIEQKIGEGEDIVEILEGLNRAAKKLLSWHKSQKK